MTGDPLFEALTFARGPAWKNRLALAPLTNLQSAADGSLSREELNWLLMRAAGGFGLTMTCAAHVDPSGQGFPGQLAVFADRHIEGLSLLAAGIRQRGSVSSIQLHHAGYRADPAVASELVAPSADLKSGARALSVDEVGVIRDAYVRAAARAAEAGFDGAELHGAHSYLITQFLSADLNRRTDAYGGALENRARLLFEILEGIRAACGLEFQLGVRLSPERFGLRLSEMRDVYTEIVSRALVDYVDLSLWDVFKMPEEEGERGRSLLAHFTSIPRGAVRLGVAGGLRGGDAARRVLAEGADFATIGRAAILRHDFPKLLSVDPAFEPGAPVSAARLAEQGVSPIFVEYLRTNFALVA